MQPEVQPDALPSPLEGITGLFGAETTVAGAFDAGVAVWWISGVVFGFVAIYSAFLLYHWLRYAFSSTVMWVGIAVYAGGLSFLFSIMMTSATGITG